MLVTFNGKVLSLAPGADDIYSPKLLSSLIMSSAFSLRRARAYSRCK
jgi:hypothetical protein